MSVDYIIFLQRPKTRNEINQSKNVISKHRNESCRSAILPPGRHYANNLYPPYILTRRQPLRTAGDHGDPMPLAHKRLCILLSTDATAPTDRWIFVTEH